MGLLTSHRAEVHTWQLAFNNYGTPQGRLPTPLCSSPPYVIHLAHHEKNASQLARFIFFPSDQKQVSLHASKRRECSQTVHYLGFLDMAAAYMASFFFRKKKQEQSLTASIIPFDLSRHIFF